VTTQFGHDDDQSGDGVATISCEEQSQVTATIVEFLGIATICEVFLADMARSREYYRFGAN